MKNSINLFLCSIISLTSFGQSDGDNLFNDNIVHQIRFSNADIGMLENGTKTYQMVQMEIDGSVIQDIGIKDKGNVSFYPDKPPLKVKTNKYVTGQEYDGIKEFTLHNSFEDPTLMREKITYELADKIGLFSMRTAFAEVYINNIYYGLYTLIEGKDELYKQRFGNRDLDAVESLDFGDMCFISNNPDDYNSDVSGWPTYQLDNGEPTTAWPLFSTLIDVANNTPSSSFYTTVNNYLNTPHFTRYQALNVYLMNFDSYIGFKGNQIYVYDETLSKWQVIPWDFNASINLWDNGNGAEYANNYPLFPSTVLNGCIAENINNVAELRYEYLDAMCEFVNIHCTPSAINARIDHIKELIAASVYNDTRKQYSNNDWDATTELGMFTISNNQFEGLKTFFNDRYNKIDQSLIAEGFDCSTALVQEVSSIELVVSPNPIQERFEIITDLPIDQVSIFSLTGKIVLEIINPVGLIELNGVSPGTYIVQAKSGIRTVRKKISIQ
ncbi:MAG: CotH kinase family protein [Crocinitomicaceae bacterium]|nr:CotH kinase family protein [Crocinitomicaceae bacterium]